MRSMLSKCIYRRKIPIRIDECIRLYTDHPVWKTPARKVSYQGRDLIKKMYLRVFSGVVDFEFTPVERWATQASPAR